MLTSKITVNYMDHMGSDLSVCQSARVSMAKQSEWEKRTVMSDTLPGVDIHYGTPQTLIVDVLSDKDVNLINYLAKHKHWTPFSHPQISFRIKAPIFVARQWFKHTIGITRNETSRRYVDEEPEFYFPDVWRGRPHGSIKQGSSGVVEQIEVDREGAPIYYDTPSAVVELFVDESLDLYETLLKGGVAPEQARMILPQNMMTEWIETASLAAVCRSVKLRIDPHAQQETREVAEQIAELVAPLFPVSWSALMDLE